MMNKWKRIGAALSFAVFGILLISIAGNDEAWAASPITPGAGGGTVVISPGDIFSGAKSNSSPLSVDVRGMRQEITEKGFATVYIEFATNSPEILPESGGRMESIGALLREEAAWCLRIVGHTDSTGDAAYNLDLSRKRAASVLQTLLHAGIAEKRLTALGMGAEKPVADNKTPEGRARNRRVELVKADCP